MKRNSAYILAEAGVMIALAMILNFFQIYTLPNGGSITLGAMVPLMFFSWLNGWQSGFLAGAAYGLLDFMFKPYFLHWIQFFFDYLLAFGVLGAAGFFKGKKSPVSVTLATVLAGGLRLLVHIISGVAFWSEGLGLGAAVIFSAQYNLSYMLPNILISVPIMILLTRRDWHGRR